MTENEIIADFPEKPSFSDNRQKLDVFADFFFKKKGRNPIITGFFGFVYILPAICLFLLT